MTRTRFTIMCVAIILSIALGPCWVGAEEVKCHVTGDVEIQWPGGGGGSCGGEEGGSCGGNEGGTCEGDGGSCGGDEGGGCEDDGGNCDGDEGGSCGADTSKYAYISIVAHQNEPSGAASGILRHWVTDERVNDDDQTDGTSDEDASDGSNLYREIVVTITYLVNKGGSACLVGECIYDSKAMKNKIGQWLMMRVTDGGTPARDGDTLAWKWFATNPLSTECSDVCLNPKELLEGNFVVHY